MNARTARSDIQIKVGTALRAVPSCLGRVCGRNTSGNKWDRSESRPYLEHDRRLRHLSRTAHWLTVILLGFAASSAAAEAPWTVPDAPIRAVVTLRRAPDNPDVGVEIKVPDFGLIKGEKTGYSLTDAAGKPVPVAVVWQGPAQDTILLARDLQNGQSYYLYIGGTAGTAWAPKTSLLFETRRSSAARGETYTSASALESAWNSAAPQAQGAKFVEKIYSADNPFGDQTFFFSHFSAYLAPTSSDMELFTNSADSSFILVNNEPFIDWTGRPSGNSTDKALHFKKLPASADPVKIDYYQAKGGGDDPPNMTMGWRKPGGHLELVPENAFLHAGKAAVDRYESQQGTPVPAPEIELVSYLGFGGAFLYEVRGKLAPADLQGAAIEWRFDDGAVLTGPRITRVMSGIPGSQRVTVTARRGAASMQVVRHIGFYGAPPPEAADDKQEGKAARNGHERYLDMLMQLDPAKLDAAMLAAALPLLFDTGTDAQIAVFANPWLALKPNLTDPLWLPASSAHIRTIAQTNPQAAIAELDANSAARQVHEQAINLLELELLVFSVHNMAAMPRVQQLAFSLGPDAGKLGEIRVGDLYRLNGDVDHAIARYQSAQPPDDSNGRKLPAEDQANSMTVEDLLDSHSRAEAAEKLGAWELAHPLAKLTTNFLVLRARLLAMYGRWREALTELEAFPATHPDSPYEIDVDYYRARSLYELGKKDEARKIWRDIAQKYPKSELAKSSREWADKS
jgi:tetratricopeptide (TPR) repeat protein